MTTENNIINNNEQESFISDVTRDLSIEAPPSQNKKKRKQNKNKSEGHISGGSNDEVADTATYGSKMHH